MRSLSRWPFIHAFAVITVCLSVRGYYGPGATNPSLIDWFASTIALFKVAPDLPSSPWPLAAARYTGAVFTIWALAKVGAQLSREQIDRLRLRYWRQHAVICGLGRKGAQLARELRQLGQRVVLTDAAPGSNDLVTCQRAGILVECGDATKSITLETVRVEHARWVFAVCGDDRTNLEIAMETLARYRQSGSKGPLSCYVHMGHLPLHMLLQRYELLGNRPAGFDLQFFNIVDITARTLFAQYPPEGFTPNPNKRVHMVVIGLTRLGEAIITQAARVGHYADRQPMLITVIDQSPEESVAVSAEDFRARQPGIDLCCELRIISMRLSEPRFARFEFLNAASVDAEVPSVVLCLDSEDENVSLALRLAGNPGRGHVPVLVRVSERRGLAKLLLAAENPLTKQHLIPFGAIEDVCRWEILREGYLDPLARAVHEHYRTTDDEAPAWDELTEDIRNSNRAAADHIDIKLRAIGCERVSQQSVHTSAHLFNFSSDEVELLSEIEHRRWSADRLICGWVFGKVKDPARKTHPDLVPWAELSDEIRQKDRNQVHAIPAILAAKNFAIRRHRTT